MFINIEPKPIEKISSSPIIQQTTYWGHLKSIQGLKTTAFDMKLWLDSESSNKDKKKIKDDLLIVRQGIGDGAEIAYIPYGPKLVPSEDQRGHILEELSENLKEFLPENTIMIRYDLPWDSPWAEEDDFYDEQGRWLGPPEPRIREFRMNFGTKEWNLRKAPTDVLPSSTFFIDLNKSEEELLLQMKAKTRYNIRLALKKGVKVYEAQEEHLPVWYELHCQTTQRNQIIHSDLDFFKTLLQAEERCHDSNTKIKLLIAEVEGKAVAGMFLSISGGRATYLYGASCDKYRHLMGSYALQWQAIRTAKSMGCMQYDMFGVSHRPDPAHPMYGLYKFKSGFGGSLYHRQGCWDYPLKNSLYSNYRAVELASEGYHYN